jgi:hypothetical protein
MSWLVGRKRLPVDILLMAMALPTKGQPRTLLPSKTGQHGVATLA